MTERREFYWVETGRATEIVGKVGLDGFGLLSIIAAQFYCGDPLADSFEAVAAHGRIDLEEWERLRARLIDAGELQIVDGLLVPTGDWHRSEKHS